MVSVGGSGGVVVVWRWWKQWVVVVVVVVGVEVVCNGGVDEEAVVWGWKLLAANERVRGSRHP